MKPIELFLCLVLAIVTAAIAVPIYQTHVAKRQLTDCCTNLKNIGTAMEMYSTDFAGRYPHVGTWGSDKEPLDLAILAPNYLSTIPTCPTGARYYAVSGV